MRVSWTISIAITTSPGLCSTRIPMLYAPGRSEPGRPRVRPAAVPVAEIAKRIEHLGVPRVVHRGPGVAAGIGQRGRAAVGRLGDQRGLPQRQSVFASSGPCRGCRACPAGRSRPERLLRLPLPLVILRLGPLTPRRRYRAAARAACREVVDRPHAAQVGIAPRRAGDLPPGGRCGVVLGRRDRVVVKRWSGDRQTATAQPGGGDARNFHGLSPYFAQVCPSWRGFQCPRAVADWQIVASPGKRRQRAGWYGRLRNPRASNPGAGADGQQIRPVTWAAVPHAE